MSKSKTKKLAEDLIYETFKLLKENNNEMKKSEIMEQIPKKIEFDDYANYVYEKSGFVRWQTILQFYSIDCVKAGFLVKKNSCWYLTEEGENIIKFGKEKIIEEANKKYKEWNNNKKLEEENNTQTEKNKEDIDENEYNEQLILEDIESKTNDTMCNFINSLNPYEFQDLCAALLRGMGYYTPFIAPNGKDGGIDIIAYKDPVGASSPRIKVQVKHRNCKATAQEVRELSGILKSDDIGIFISTGGFTPDADKEVKIRNNHIEFIDMGRFN